MFIVWGFGHMLILVLLFSIFIISFYACSFDLFPNFIFMFNLQIEWNIFILYNYILSFFLTHSWDVPPFSFDFSHIIIMRIGWNRNFFHDVFFLLPIVFIRCSKTQFPIVPKHVKWCCWIVPVVFIMKKSFNFYLLGQWPSSRFHSRLKNQSFGLLGCAILDTCIFVVFFFFFYTFILDEYLKKL